MNGWLIWFIDAVQSVDWLLRDLIAGLAMLLETSLFVGLLIPGDTVVLVAAIGVQNVLDYFGLLGFVLAGSICGETIGFFIGRLFGERIRRSWLGRRLGESNWRIADHFIETRGGLAVGISRFLPILHALVPVVSGMSRMRYRVFISWTAAACALWAGIYVSLGWLAHTSADELVKKLHYGSYVFLGLMIVVAVGAHFGKKRLEAKAEAMIAQSEAASAAVAGGKLVTSTDDEDTEDLKLD